MSACKYGSSMKQIGLAVRGGNTECTDTGCLGTVYWYGSKCTGIPEPTQGAELSLSMSLSLTKMAADVSFSLLLPTRHLVFLPSLSLCLSLLPICPWQRNKETSKPGVEVKLLTAAIGIRREREKITATLCTPVYRCKIPVLG